MALTNRHAAAYAIGLPTKPHYLKANFPLALMSALWTLHMSGNADKLANFVSEAKRMTIADTSSLYQ